MNNNYIRLKLTFKEKLLFLLFGIINKDYVDSFKSINSPTVDKYINNITHEENIEDNIQITDDIIKEEAMNFFKPNDKKIKSNIEM